MWGTDCGERWSRKAKEQVAVMVQWEPMGNKSPVGATDGQKCVGPDVLKAELDLLIGSGMGDEIRKRNQG